MDYLSEYLRYKKLYLGLKGGTRSSYTPDPIENSGNKIENFIMTEKLYELRAKITQDQQYIEKQNQDTINLLDEIIEYQIKNDRANTITNTGFTEKKHGFPFRHSGEHSIGRPPQDHSHIPERNPENLGKKVNIPKRGADPEFDKIYRNGAYR
jgi:hypothetical protein